MDYNPPGSSVHGIFQARILEWVAISYSRGSSQPQGLNLSLLCLLNYSSIFSSIQSWKKKIRVHFVFFKISRWLNFLLLLPFSQQFFKKSKVHFLPIVTYWYFCMTYKWSTIMMSHGYGKSHVCSEMWNGHRKHLVHSGPVYYQLPLRDSCITLWVTLPSVLLSIVTASYTHESFHQRWLCGPLRDAFGNQNACLQMSVQHREWLP